MKYTFFSAFSLKQEGLNAASLACDGSVKERSALSTSSALGQKTWREQKV